MGLGLGTDLLPLTYEHERHAPGPLAHEREVQPSAGDAQRLLAVLVARRWIEPAVELTLEDAAARLAQEEPRQHCELVHDAPLAALLAPRH